jgi:hypothetical protein
MSHQTTLIITAILCGALIVLLLWLLAHAGIARDRQQTRRHLRGRYDRSTASGNPR